MQNIKSKGDKFLVEIKNNQGEYEPLGVLSLHEAVEVSFTTHHAIRMQKVGNGNGQCVSESLENI